MDQFLETVLSIADNPTALFFVLFIAAFINTFVPPVPIEVGTVFAGYLVSEGHGSLLIIITATTLGMFAGSVLFYRIARHFGPGILKKPFFAKLLNEQALNRTRDWFKKYGAISLFATKFVPGLYFCAVISSGIIAIKESKIYPAFLFANLAAFTVHAYVGKIAGEKWRLVYMTLGKTGVIALSAAILSGALIYLFIKYLRKQPLKDS